MTNAEIAQIQYIEERDEMKNEQNILNFNIEQNTKWDLEFKNEISEVTHQPLKEVLQDS